MKTEKGIGLGGYCPRSDYVNGNAMSLISFTLIYVNRFVFKIHCAD